MKKTHLVEILCPERKCRKCEKLLQFMNNYIVEEKITASIQIITQPEKMLSFNTWILPSVIVNKKVVSRGYVPAKNKLKEAFEKKIIH